MRMRLKKDIVIKAGTIFDTAASEVSRDPEAYVECVFGLTKDSYGIVTYQVGDEGDMLDPKHRRAIRRWFEEVKYTEYESRGCTFAKVVAP